MRALQFYPKLAAGNLWRNRSTYLPYLLACVVSIFTLYTLLAINFAGTLDGVRGESVVKSFTAVGAFILSLFCAALIFYTNSFLIKRRKKELGLYSVLGMEKKNIALLMLFETLFVAVVALVLGLGLGMLLSQLLYWALLRLVRYPVMLNMQVSPQALGVATAFFALVFLLTLLSNLRQVRLASPIGLMAGANQGEKEPRGSLVLSLLGLLFLGGGYFVALYFTSPLEVIMFFLLAVLMVILGTYCLFLSGSILLLKLLRRNKKFYYRPQHFISVSGMIYRMKQNAAGLATICILSCMVLVTVSSTVALNVGAEDSLNTQYPYECELRVYEPQDHQPAVEKAQEIAKNSGVGLENLQSFQRWEYTASSEGSQFDAVSQQSYSPTYSYFSMITLESYNQNENTAVELAEGEALLLVSGGEYREASLTLNGITYKVRPLESFGKMSAGSRDLARSFVLVLPSQAALEQQLATVDETMLSTTSTVQFDLSGSDAAKDRFATELNGYLEEQKAASQGSVRLTWREGAREGWYATNGGFLFLGLYFGILFLLAAALIIYYKQLSEGYDDAARFAILQKVGMGEAEVKKTINSQILLVFFLPLLVSLVHVAVAFFPISRAMILFGVLNIPLLVLASVFTALAYALVYLLVFRQTARSYFGIVRRRAS